MVVSKEGKHSEHLDALTTFKCYKKGQQEERVWLGRKGVAKTKMKNSVASVKGFASRSQLAITIKI